MPVNFSILRPSFTLALAVLTVLELGACRKKKVPEIAAQNPAAAQISRPNGEHIIPQTRPQIPSPTDPVSREIENVTSAHARIVWNEFQTTGDADPYSQESNSALMGLDTRDGLGERAIIKEKGNYTRPILSTDGKTILFTRRSREQNANGRWVNATTIYRTDWIGAALVEVAEGQAVDAWRDPATGLEWIYAVRHFRGSRSAGIIATELVRYQLDDAKKEQVIFEDAKLTPDNMQVSRDGTRISGLFPWPNGGILISDGKTFSTRKLQIGCWTSLAPDDSGLSWVFDGEHKSASIFNAEGTLLWPLKFNAPALEHAQTYHPRWSNHARFITLTGPFKDTGVSGNIITHGGAHAQVFLGRLNERARKVETWVQVSHSDLSNSFPDAWIEGGETANLVLAPSAPAKTNAPAASWPTTPDGLLFIWRNRAALNNWIGRDGKTNEARLDAHGTARFGRSGELFPDGGKFEIEKDENKPSPLFLRSKEKPDFAFEALIIPLAKTNPIVATGGLILHTPSLCVVGTENTYVVVEASGNVEFTVPATPFHLVVQHNADGITVFINGQQTATASAPGRSLDKDAFVSLGDHWHGGLKNIAFYDRNLTADEISKNAAAQLDQIKVLPAPAPQVRLRGKLVETSKVPTAESIEPYTRALVAYVYEVESVLAGEYKDKRVLVKHWALLDRAATEGFPREKGQSYELTLERESDHPELTGERVMDDTGAFDMQAWLDVAPPRLPPTR